MSRALNLNASKEHVLETCNRQNAIVTQIETLASGGTRVVLMNEESAIAVGRVYRESIITDRVVRAPLRTARR